MKKNIINKVGVVALAALSLSACSDEFLTEKKNYDNVNAGIYDYYEGAYARVSDVYSWCLPDACASANWKYNCTGLADDQSKSTEEYSGFSIFVNPEKELKVQDGSVPDYFHNQANNIQASVWGRIRNINDVIRGINAGSLSDDQKDELLGQMYFFRAWCYYQMVKWYGGVPIVSEVLEPLVENSTPRSSAKACFDFIIKDLDMAADKLQKATGNGGWKSSADWGHVTTGTALALKGRVLLLWASPLFNRGNDKSRWDNAYKTMKNDLARINGCGYDLYKPGNTINGSAFAGIFNQTRSSEHVFVTLYNTVQSGDPQKNNTWERTIRPKNTTGSGLNPSAMIVDMFPMADGCLPTACNTFTKLPRSAGGYDASYPFYNRDPRFYRTFAFPGVRWAYNGDATQQDPNNPDYNKGADYELWNYYWYTSITDAGNVEGTGYAADNLLNGGKAMYVRKRSDDADVSSPLYGNWSASANQSGFIYSAAPYIEIRYAEVLLNLAEAAAGAGDEHLGEAKELLKAIRLRAGYSGECGLDKVQLDQATVMSAVLYERLIELAYEGKRFDDLRRWMLFDGGQEINSIEGAPASWKLTGWGGNTCTWLGFTPLNGQRRENMEFMLKPALGTGGTTHDSDPLFKFMEWYKTILPEILSGDIDEEMLPDYFADAGYDKMPTDVIYPTDRKGIAIDLRNDITVQQEKLKEFYYNFLVRKEKKGDAYDQNKVELYMHFFPKYYFLGIPTGAMNSDANLLQTIGWEDSNNGYANGTFDPLAE